MDSVKRNIQSKMTNKTTMIHWPGRQMERTGNFATRTACVNHSSEIVWANCFNIFLCVDEIFKAAVKCKASHADVLRVSGTRDKLNNVCVGG